MKIEIKNIITMDKEVEIITETYDGQLIEKGDYLYLIYQNEEAERVVIKYNLTDLTMTRFSKPQTVMTFSKKGPKRISIATPLGPQVFVTDTVFYRLDDKQNLLELKYKLLQADTDKLFATYHLEIKWS
ncbi:DUF1934 domain-containing protein [Streptococcus didelphis]|uniref:DUF1934 domain-containing protein n=1 Tax=Streptococcus didelphis TaxID=102886 RepID=A0ABY9LHV7_9STRE|nr:DUF1934 domain-containing protein [Streptococcus didelphis]WMB28424.1 DUF1934 domain-containing protein [Streptococcus didelphis]WMB29100.1 DUF1934 domain-containing protein [Streptococcus didelphis]